MKKVAIVGNPNSGKSSLFNNLTGLQQKVGNYPGVTVDRKSGFMHIAGERVEVLDLPGTYSVYSQSEDERVSMRILLEKSNLDFPDLVIIVIDATHLSRNLLFFSQIRDLGFPCVIALTMVDIAAGQGISIDINELQRKLSTSIVAINPRRKKGTSELIKVLENYHIESSKLSYLLPGYRSVAEKLDAQDDFLSPYAGIVYACDRGPEFRFLSPEKEAEFDRVLAEADFKKNKFQAEDISHRFREIKKTMEGCVFQKTEKQKELYAERLDKVLLHKHWGYLILFFILFIVFQSIYRLAAWPMDMIESLFRTGAGFMRSWLPSSVWTDLWIDGIWSGISGVVIFIPQIAILFALINILEDSGYMARISFLTDRLFRKFGLSGKSTMPLISSFACAVPAIMATRTIPNPRERLIAILTSPILSCSARLPVYIIMIGLLIPNRNFLGFISLQGLVLLGLYLVGIVFMILSAYFFNKILKSKSRSPFILELPHYRYPNLRNIIMSAYEKTQIFVVDAGKVILIISVILWFLASHGPRDKMQEIRDRYAATEQSINPEVNDRLMASELLAHSYAGYMGKSIEPLIRPLGFDWKIGIALISSFAAREVFVSTMSTIYTLGDSSEDQKLIQKMNAAVDDQGRQVFTFATGMSLLVFYILAMQCMSTLAVVRRETKSWKWPMVQLGYMSALAYIAAYLTQIILA